MKAKVALFALALGTLLTSCAAIPSSSPIHKLPNTQQSNDTQFVRVIARPPALNAKPLAIVKGFLDACADTSGDYSIARKYLLDSVSEQWQPDSQMTTFDSATLSIANSGNNFRVSGSITGYVDVFQRYSAEVSPKPLDYALTLSRDAKNQWRIRQLPDGVIAPLSDVQRRIKGFPVYFFDQQNAHLVPDYVVVPRGSSGTATALMQALLAGPRAQLVAYLNSQIPNGAKLNYGSVPVSNGIATVDLSLNVNSLQPVTYSRLATQIVWTLDRIDSVRKVRILFSGRPYPKTDLPAVLSTQNFARYSPQRPNRQTALFIAKGAKLYSTSVATQNLIAEIPVDTSASTSTFTSSQLSGSVAVVGDAGKNLFVKTKKGTEFRQVFAGEFLSKPSWSRSGRIFVADYGHWIASISPSGDISFLRVEKSVLGEATDVSRVAMAPDGVRIALLFGTTKASTLAIGILIPDGVHTRVVAITPVLTGLTNVRDVDWVDESHIALLSSTSTDTSDLQIVSLADGSREIIQIPFESRSFTFGSNGQVVLSAVRNGTPQILERRQGAWIEIAKANLASFSAR